jgi:hypothetical protein
MLLALGQRRQQGPPSASRSDQLTLPPIAHRSPIDRWAADRRSALDTVLQA